MCLARQTKNFVNQDFLCPIDVKIKKIPIWIGI
jgi:hypothetical protein